MKIKDKESKNKLGKITISILKEIGRILESTAEGFYDPYILMKDHNYEQNKRFIYIKRLHNLNRQGYIKYKKTDKGYSVCLTNKGKIKLLENNNHKKYDGKWRILSFDIPEKLCNKRNALRRIIKKIGFKQVQKSLWICPFNKADQIDLVIREMELTPYVAYFIAEKTDISDYLKIKFNIVSKK